MVYRLLIHITRYHIQFFYRAMETPAYSSVNKKNSFSSIKYDFFRTPTERKQLDDMAELYAILRTIDALENALVKDLVVESEYVRECEKLINSFSTLEKSLIQNGVIESREHFVRKYNIDCRLALDRLSVGAPQQSNTTSKLDERAKLKIVKDLGQLILSCTDSLSLGVEMDAFVPIFRDLMRLIDKGKKEIFPNFDSSKLEAWFATLQQMKAQDKFTPEDVRNFRMDLETANDDINHALDH